MLSQVKFFFTSIVIVVFLLNLKNNFPKLDRIYFILKFNHCISLFFHFYNKNEKSGNFINNKKKFIELWVLDVQELTTGDRPLDVKGPYVKWYHMAR